MSSNTNENNTSSPTLNASTAALYQVFRRLQQIGTNGPSSPSEWWIHELLKYTRRDPDATHMKFDIAALCLGFRLLQDVFPTRADFLPDICSLVMMLPIKDGDQIERKLLVQLLVETAKQCGMGWWEGKREQAAILFGVMHACMIQRRVSTRQDGHELGELMEKVDLGRDDVEVMNRLAESLEGELKIKI